MATKDERIIEIVVNGQKANANLKEMNGAARALSSQLQTLTPGTKEFVEASQQLREVKARINEVKASMNGVAQEQASIARGSSVMKQGLSAAMGAFAGGGALEAVQKVWGFLTDSRAEFLASAKASADLGATLKSTGHAAGLTAAEIRAIGEARAKVTLFDDDETNRASAMLLTFTNIKKGVFEEALPAIQDIATKMGGDGPADLKGASIQVGKALNDPIKGITALTRVGVSFTDAQKEQITQLVKTGHAADAQRLILAELNKEFGGSAEAARKAAGGLATAQMGWNEFKETVGEKVQAALESLSQWFGKVLDNSQPLVDFVGELVAEFKGLYRELGEVLEGMGLLTNQTDSAKMVVELLRVALTILLAPLRMNLAIYRGIIDAFADWYNKSELLRKVLSGLGGYITSVFYSIKDGALKALGGVGNLLLGIFTLDKAKIAAGLKQTLDATADLTYRGGMKAAGAFADAYDKGKDKRIVRRSAAEQANDKAREEDAATQGTREAEAAAGASAKEREKARKKAEAEHKKHLAALEKARKEFQAESRRADYEFEKLKVEAMQEGIDKVLAKLKLERDEELRGLEEKKAKVLANVAATAREKQHLLDQYNETGKLAEARYQQDVTEARAKQATADEAARKKTRDEKFAELDAEAEEQLVLVDNAWLEQRLHLKKQSAEYLKAEQARADAELRLRRKVAAAKLALLQAEGKAETTEAKKLRNAILKIDGELADGQADSDKRLTELKKTELQQRQEFELNMASAQIQIGEAVLDAVLERLDKESTAYQVAQAIRKTLALAEIGINLQRELAANAVAASLNPLNGVTAGGAGAAQLAVANTLSVVRAAVAAATVIGFARGGYTGDGDGQRDATGYKVAGVVHEGEWVAPKWMLQQPKYANLIGYLEAERRGYAAGGYAQPAALPPSAAGGGSQADPALLAMMSQLIGVVQQQNRHMNEWQSRLGVDYHAGNADEAMQLRRDLKKKASL